MMRSLLLKTLYDKRWFALGWTLGMAMMCWLTIMFFPALKQGDALSQLSKQLPENLGALKGLIGDQETFNTIGGYISAQLYDIRLSLFMMITAIMLALSLGVGDEERGRLRTILATPMSRNRVIFEQWSASLIILSVTIIGTLIGVIIGVIAINEQIPFKLLAQLTFMSLLFTTAVFTLTYSIAIGFGRRSWATTFGLILAFSSFILSTFGPIVSWLKDWQVLSLLNYFSPKTILHEGIDWWHVAVLLALIAIFYLIANIGFRNRDINGG
jgi:ABC-2 type transport system permease protein